MKSTIPNAAELERKWYVIDADGVPLGRLAVQVANLMRGRTKPIYTPHVDTGDFVIVLNAAKVKLSGRKEELKTYATYSGFRGGHRTKTAAEVRARHPERLIHKAVGGMLPKNRLGRSLATRLKVYAGDEHPHAAQMPQMIEG